TLALPCPGEDRGGPFGLGHRFGVRVVDLPEVVAVDLDDVPVEGADAPRVRACVPAETGRPALPEPIDVDDRRQVAEPALPGLLERLPHRALGELAVAAQDPDPRGRAVEVPAGHRDTDADREPLAERSRGDVDPGQTGGG